MAEDVDDDGSGTIGYEEFLKMMTHKILNRDPKDQSRPSTPERSQSCAQGNSVGP